MAREVGISLLNQAMDQVKVGLEIKDTAKPTLAANYVALEELKNNDRKAYDNLISASNMKTTLLTIATNSLVGGVINKDFWIVPYKNKMVETKTGQFWKTLAMLFSVKPIKQIKVQVLKKGDTYEFAGMPTRLVSYTPSLDTNGNKLDNVLGAYAEVEYEDDTYDSRVITREELLDIREASPSKNSDFSPWNKWASKMVESKVLRELILRNISLDQSKINEYGYKQLIKDDQPLKEKNGNIITIDDYPEEDKVLSQVDEVIANTNKEEITDEDLEEINKQMNEEIRNQ